MKSRGPVFAVLMAAAALVGSFYSALNRGAMDREFADLPVLNGGRVKPLDSVARNALLVLSGKQTIRLNDRPLTAASWLLDMSFKPALADTYAVFEIDDPEVLGTLNIQAGGRRRFSFDEIRPKINAIQTQAAHAFEVRPEIRTRYQTNIARLWDRLILYWKLQNTLEVSGTGSATAEAAAYEEALAAAAAPAPKGKKKSKDVPEPARLLAAYGQRHAEWDGSSEYMAVPLLPASDDNWATIGRAYVNRAREEAFHPAVLAYARLGDAHRAGNAESFKAALSDYKSWLNANASGAAGKARRESVLNRFKPFYVSLQLYVVVFLLLFVSFLRWTDVLRRTAYGLLVLAFVVHTGGLFVRIVLEGRPPVTNLYSSAVFVGWCAAFLGLVIERMYKNGLAGLGAAIVGFVTQIIAHHLAQQGDTMEMMRAVLDSNFWLATHVITITVGYASTFLSGALGIVYILRGMFSKKFSEESAKALGGMVYGIVCFSAFFSFIGTVLGGIWADQSWGRFWGWDPKENGALMIVLWSALILHARWGNMISRRGLMVLAVFGNIITALSWFGVNMLGIGLHSYGFMDKAFPWLAAFVLSQAVVMLFGMLPARFWASYR